MKLPKPVKRGDAYRIQLQIDGKRVSCTRDTIKECEQWAARKILESKIDQQNVSFRPILHCFVFHSALINLQLFCTKVEF